VAGLYSTGSCGVKNVRLLLGAGPVWVFLVLLGACGCGGSPQVKIEIPPAHNNMRNLTIAYLNATSALNRPPKNADELKTPAKTLGVEVKDLTTSPIDGAELVIQWGVDIRALKSQDGKYPIWAYEKNPHGGKRWVLQSRNPVEMTEEEFKSAPLAPGMKRP